MTQFYFTINLNKFGELRKQREAESKLFMSLVVIFAIITVILYATVIYFNLTLSSKLENRRDLLQRINDEIQQYQDSGEYLSTGDLERLARTSTERIFWANKLIALADITTDKIAITHFSYKDDVLSLFGITQVDIEEREFDLIYEFIENLRVNDQINVDFDEIRFVRSNRDREKDVEILRFQIDCIGRNISARDRRRRL
ncbi:MAG: hypothetical protein K0B81_02580 [Candidatus Cloacimonetes bacterium]|nr:hypothetical protein [Candidatus Cloacimonadota bacterium]